MARNDDRVDAKSNGRPYERRKIANIRHTVKYQKRLGISGIFDSCIQLTERAMFQWLDESSHPLMSCMSKCPVQLRPVDGFKDDIALLSQRHDLLDCTTAAAFIDQDFQYVPLLVLQGSDNGMHTVQCLLRHLSLVQIKRGHRQPVTAIQGRPRMPLFLSLFRENPSRPSW